MRQEQQQSREERKEQNLADLSQLAKECAEKSKRRDDHIPPEVLPVQQLKKRDIQFDREPDVGKYPPGFPPKEAIVRYFHKAITDP